MNKSPICCQRVTQLVGAMNLDPFDYDRRWHSREDEANTALQWFHDYYYDPTAEAAAGINRRYRWLPQDTISPYEVLQAQFSSKLTSHTISEISEELRIQSSNWRARPDEFPIDFEISQRQSISASDGEEPAARAELLAAIAALEASISSIARPRPLYGHNMPPEGISDESGSTAQLDSLIAAVADMKAHVLSHEADTTPIAKGQVKLLGFTQTVMNWSATRGTKFVDSVLDSGGKAIGTALVLQLTGILPQVYAVVSAAGRLLAALAN